MAVSKINNSDFFDTTLAKAIKSLRDIDLVEIFNFDETIWFFIREISEIWVCIYSSFIIFFL